MSPVVQAACPGCKATLTIPAEWLSKPLRCKKCHTVLQAKHPAATPAPSSRPVPPPTPGRDSTPLPPPRPAPASAAPFDFTAAAEPRRRPPRGGGGSVLVGLAILIGVVLLTAAIGVAFWPKIQPLLRQAALVAPPEEEKEDEPPAARAVVTPAEKPVVKKPVTPDKGGRPTPRQNPEPTPKPRVKPKEPPVLVGKAGFPRRALIISVHNYLYANPISQGYAKQFNVDELTRSLANNLNIPLPQIAHISDGAARNSRPPLKPVIEQGLQNFLRTTRRQDRIVVFFIGHTREIAGEPYLVPLDGDFADARSLIPLKWVYEQLGKCAARQKVFVLDGNRYSASQGEERPVAGPMGPALEKMLKAPPAGVQVIASCSGGQLSHEFDDSPLGLFLSSFRTALAPTSPAGMKSALAGQTQRPDDLLPVEAVARVAGENMLPALKKRDLKQTPLVAGAPPPSGAAYDASEPPADEPAIPRPELGNAALVRDILAEIDLPPVKRSEGVSVERTFALLPPFPPEALRPFEAGALPPESKLRQAIHEARVILWSISGTSAPAELSADIRAFRERKRFTLDVLKDRYRKPAASADARFKDGVFKDSRALAPIVHALEMARDELKSEAVLKEKKTAPKRWQANHSLILARTLAQLAYLEEHNNLLGQLRREYPTHDPALHDGWRMASKDKASDAAGKKLERELRGLYTNLTRDCRGTPWEVLARREGLTRLGLEWQPTTRSP